MAVIMNGNSKGSTRRGGAEEFVEALKRAEAETRRNRVTRRRSRSSLKAVGQYLYETQLEAAKNRREMR